MTKLVLPENHPYINGRVCSTCETFKDADKFRLERDDRYLGSISMRSKCIECDEHRKWKADIIRRYGITHKEYYRMLDNQGGKCAVCGSTENNNGRCKTGKLFIDHCHTTGKVRGLLCSKCNHGLGLFDDDIDRLQQAINYLNNFQRN